MKQKIIITDNFLDTPLEYKKAKTQQPIQEISNKIAHILQSNVVLHTENNQSDYIAVLYLDFPTECLNKTGVSFWLHKETLEEEYPNETKMKWLGIQSMEEGYKFDEENYEKYMSYFVKYNRLILFDSKMFYTDGDESDCRKFYVKINNQ